MSINDISYIARACLVYCDNSDVLKSIQLAAIYNDSKTFVDMPIKYDPELVLEAFYNISDSNDKVALEQFLFDYFEEAGSDLEQWIPIDYNTKPNFLSKINNLDYKEWAYELNELWLTLGRKTKEDVYKHPQRHSYLPRYYPMIVPGGRFRESYYWDSYWIVRGLLVCDMHTTAKYVINNLLNDIHNFGFIPNGGRVYYLDRSQPPVLSEMIVSYMDYMIAKYGYSHKIYKYIEKAYKLLQIEYNWWMNPINGHVIELLSNNNNNNNSYNNDYIIKLNRYYSNSTTPRPESYLEDYEQVLSNNSNNDINIVSNKKFYSNIRAGAESGWDFSSRWISFVNNSFELSNIDTNEVIPIDLNCILYRFELNMVKLAQYLDIFYYDFSKETNNNMIKNDYINDIITFTFAANSRKHGINLYMWDIDSYHWRDYNLTSEAWVVNRPQEGYKSIAYWIPMWAGIQPPSEYNTYHLRSDTTDTTSSTTTTMVNSSSGEDLLVESLLTSALIQVGGVLTTTSNTGQQWDASNAWPPLVLFTIEGLQKRNTTSSLKLAEDLSSNWLDTCYLAYNNTGYMYEKYDAYHKGIGGGGGEYQPQVGFGWSNAVVLILLNNTYLSTINSSSTSSSSMIYNHSNNIIVQIESNFLFLSTNIRGGYPYIDYDHRDYYLCLMILSIVYILFLLLK